MSSKKHTDALIEIYPDDEQILITSGKFRVPFTATREEVWKKLGFKKARQVNLFTTWMSKAAAIILIAAATFTLYKYQHIQVDTLRAEHKSVKLPDNSTVMLNAESSLSYNSLLWSINRKVNFKGEGFFEVEKGSRFTVFTPNGTVTVLGTSFNVIARSSLYKVACISGKVKVECDTKTNAVILTPGLHTEASDEKSLSAPVPYEDHQLSWTNGEFHFNQASLASVIETLERQYNINIQLQTTEQRTYTGYFTNKNLDEALKLVCLPLGLEYKISQADEVIIFNKKINV